MLAMERLPPTQPFTSALSLSSPTLESPRAGMTTPLGLVPQSPTHGLHSPLTLTANHVGKPGNVLMFPRSGSTSSPNLPLSPYDTGHAQSYGHIGASVTGAYSTHGMPPALLPITSSGDHPQPDSASALASPNLPAPPTTVSVAAVGTGSSTPPKREGSSTSSCEGKQQIFTSHNFCVIELIQVYTRVRVMKLTGSH